MKPYRVLIAHSCKFWRGFLESELTFEFAKRKMSLQIVGRTYLSGKRLAQLLVNNEFDLIICGDTLKTFEDGLRIAECLRAHKLPVIVFGSRAPRGKVPYVDIAHRKTKRKKPLIKVVLKKMLNNKSAKTKKKKSV